MVKISLISGGFDPCETTHIRLINAAGAYGHVCVLLNSDEWVIRNKGRLLDDWNERKKTLLSLTKVIEVWEVDDADNTVCNGLEKIRKDFPKSNITFCNGGNWTAKTLPELRTCETLDIKMEFNVGNK